MVEKVILNDTPFTITNFHEETVVDQATGKELKRIGFDFEVTSDEYHDVTTLLYENDFRVEVPENDLDFQAAISFYSTSLTNLYEKDQVSDYKLELTEKA